MSTDDYNICKSFAEMDDNIRGAGIIENMKVVAIYSKRNIPLPKEERFQLMVSQSEIFVSIAKSNADFFGRLRYVTASFESSDIIFFFLPNGSSSNNKPGLFGIRVLRPYDMTKLLEKLHISYKREAVTVKAIVVSF
jgi:exonuclease III